MKKILITTILFLSAIFLIKFNVSAALTLRYPEYNVDIKINKDTTLDITETAVYRLTGEAHGLRRDITLSDPQRDSKCQQVQDFYCGGFDRIELIKVSDLDGKDITKQIDTYKVTDEDTSIESFRIEWEIWPNGNDVSNYEIGWIIEYKIHGSILNLKAGDYFYWNLLPSQRGGNIAKSQINIEIPDIEQFDFEDFVLYGDLEYTYYLNTNSIQINLENLLSYGDVTGTYRFNKGVLTIPGNIKINSTPPIGTKIEMDGFDQTENISNGILKSVSVGKHKVTVSHIGYITQVFDVNVKSGETVVLEAKLEPEPWMTALLLLNTLIFVCGICLVPIFALMYYMHYRNKGKDQQAPKTIIPLFHPPENVRPYLLGSLKDESVDKEDIVGSIIDLAYRGFIKIEEITKDTDYKLTRTAKLDIELDGIEKSLISALFDGSESVKTSELRGKFLTEYIKLQEKIYAEMVQRGYFVKSPRTVIASYVGLGTLTLMIGIFSGCLLSTLFISVTGYFSIFTPSIALVILGIAIIISAKFMPAKTPIGSKVFGEILGFKMYLNTAERYRVQKLEPEEFVKYLSYAIVFGIEKEWADKFKDIYKGVPDWYVGSTNGFYDAYWISNFTRNFSNSTIQNIAPVASTSSGSGWSGGGSFGGFSGGGGGGGSSGAW